MAHCIPEERRATAREDLRLRVELAVRADVLLTDPGRRRKSAADPLSGPPRPPRLPRCRRHRQPLRRQDVLHLLPLVHPQRDALQAAVLPQPARPIIIVAKAKAKATSVVTAAILDLSRAERALRRRGGPRIRAQQQPHHGADGRGPAATRTTRPGSTSEEVEAVLFLIIII